MSPLTLTFAGGHPATAIMLLRRLERFDRRAFIAESERTPSIFCANRSRDYRYKSQSDYAKKMHGTTACVPMYTSTPVKTAEIRDPERASICRFCQ